MVRCHPSVTVLACMAVCWSDAALAAPRYRVDLPSIPLTDAIARISARAGVSIVTSDPGLLAKKGRALHLAGTVAEILSALLQATGARAEQVGPSSWRIVAQPRPDPPRLRRPPVVAAPAVADIVVTGSKRGTVLSHYPASVTVIDGALPGAFGGAPNTDAIARIAPSLQSTHLGSGRNKLFLRGISDSSFNGSGAVLVGLYVNDLRLTYNAPDPDLRLYDVDRVEILEGPQGTLYGAGSMAGLIRITPRAPDLAHTAGQAWIGGASVAHGGLGGDIGGTANLPLFGGHAALRVVGYGAVDGGYIDDRARNLDNVNRSSTVGGRATLRIALGGQWLLDLGVIGQDIRNDDAQYAQRGMPLLSRSSVGAQPSFNRIRAEQVTLSGAIGALDVTSTTGAVAQRLGQVFLPTDGNAGSIYRQRDGIQLLSQELKLSRRGKGGVDWLAGVSALKNVSDQTRTASVAGFARSLGRAHNDITEVTAFGELTAPLATTLTVTAGARFSAVRHAGRASGAQERTAAPDLSRAELALRGTRHEYFAVPSLALAWSVNPGWLVYARFSGGYRPGGQTASDMIERFDADRMTTIETGVRLLPHGAQRISAQLSAASSDWRHIQADVLTASGLPITRNIGDGVVRSLTASAEWKPNDALRARIAGTLAQGSVRGFDMAVGHITRTPLPNIARDTVAASVDYGHAIDARHRVTLGLSVNHVGPSVLGSGHELSRIRQGGYWLLASGTDLLFGRDSVSIDIDNLLDSAANSFAFGVPSFSFGSDQLTPLRPRTVRLGLHHRF